ncbi:MAG: pseudouridine synthase [Vampirovibrionia bacterium]|jgi:23S rRNA pseudouridine2604 synthase
MRLNKFLADQGLCSRRQADLKISQGLVSVNTVTVNLGCCLESGDRVNYADKEYIYNPESSQRLIYLALNKPAGVECTCNEEIKGNLIHFLEKNPKFQELKKLRLYPIGRLDKNSRGLLILTNDGDITHKLSHPKFEHEKEYLVTVDKPITKKFLKDLSAGVEIIIKKNGVKARTLPCLVNQESETSFKIILKQGYKRQIRQSCKVLGYEVVDLLRFRIVKLNLYELSLNEGEFKLIDNLYY